MLRSVWLGSPPTWFKTVKLLSLCLTHTYIQQYSFCSKQTEIDPFSSNVNLNVDHIAMQSVQRQIVCMLKTGNKSSSLFVSPPNKQKRYQKLWSTNITSVWVPELQAARNCKHLSSVFGCSIKRWCTAGHARTGWVFSVTSCSEFHVHTWCFLTYKWKTKAYADTMF